MKNLTPLLLVLLLSACGGSNDANFVVSPPAPAAEPFFARVMGFVGSMADDTEPADVSTVAVTQPEDAEPSGL